MRHNFLEGLKILCFRAKALAQIRFRSNVFSSKRCRSRIFGEKLMKHWGSHNLTFWTKL